MRERFPTVGVIGAGHHARMMLAPAIALGVDLLLFAADEGEPGAQVAHHIVGDQSELQEVLSFARKCNVITIENSSVPLSVIKGLENQGIKVYPTSSSLLYSQDKEAMRSKLASLPHLKLQRLDEIDSELEIAVLVARSPHRQATSWAPVEITRKGDTWLMTQTPASKISPSLAERAQQLALEISQSLGVIGVMAVEMFIKDEDLYLKELVMHPHFSGLWSIDGAVTSQYEQHLRAILDLPLGSPEMICKSAVTGNVLSGSKPDMYRPYLHLMARNPALRFHQYRNQPLLGGGTGHITACGDQPVNLIEEIEHARDYMSGVIED